MAPKLLDASCTAGPRRLAFRLLPPGRCRRRGVVAGGTGGQTVWVELVVDADEAGRTFKAARDGAPVWPGWGACVGCYLVWVDSEGQLQSMLFLDPDRADNTTKAQMAEIARRNGVHIERADGSDVTETMPTTLLYIVVDVDGTIAGPGYGQLGLQPSRCRPVSELLERAISDLVSAVRIIHRSAHQPGGLCRRLDGSRASSHGVRNGGTLAIWTASSSYGCRRSHRSPARRATATTGGSLRCNVARRRWGCDLAPVPRSRCPSPMPGSASDRAPP